MPDMDERRRMPRRPRSAFRDAVRAAKRELAEAHT